MKKCIYFIFCLLIFILINGCSLKELDFQYSNGTGLNITKEKYNKISIGSSYSTVKSIIGGNCNNYYSDEEEDWYNCIDDEDSSKIIILKFVNNKLEHKASSGLN